ncbi:hypothetical protein PPL_06905 [Heterostelium album PN500]|uniref:Glycerate kinase n=1 Tax=Heterostelium pallidum (strain ATCC 26659 / Pp 5 / PN500) TaxID=670386 RepID=D3BDV2_HETP5|nr:hypothetical protein PPL_06905 [Heterostelium album PN500]EFA80083.1 hypothetical protein PPL_06905 [Heterostelium album PN500]|eukprot:XP_020432203.1 hypothetical protein PPL_06905 [Heterostelium album PN500]
MKILIAVDKFKDCISSKDIGNAISNSIDKSLNKDLITTSVLGISDGGEGFLESLISPLNLTVQHLNVTGPLCNEITSKYAYNAEKKIAVVEMALASGLELVERSLRNPLNTTTRGTGELIAHAIHVNGCKHIVIGAGGSATNDGGLGALVALGIQVTLNDDSQPRYIVGRHLANVKSIVLPQQVREKLKDVHFEFCTDVTTPFVGERGATHTFAKQKGASVQDRETLEQGMINVANLLTVDIRHREGTGAAGGLAGGFVSLLGATISKGMDYVCKLIQLDQHIKDSDIIITGEGCFDSTSLAGKAVTKILDLGDQYNKSIIIICGCLGDQEEVKKEVDTKWKCIKSICDLQSRYGNEASMNKTRECIDRLIDSEILPMILLNKK